MNERTEGEGGGGRRERECRSDTGGEARDKMILRLTGSRERTCRHASMDRGPNNGSIANAASADRAIRNRANGQNDSTLSSRTFCAPR